jgi:uncharacterized protein (DUF58 family)
VSLRQRALLLILVTALVAVLGTWSASTSGGALWALPAALLLAGLAYEVAELRRVRVNLAVEVPEPWPLGRAQLVRFTFRQDSARVVAIQVALRTPEALAGTWRVERLLLRSGAATSATLSATPGRLGEHTWPAPAMRVAGALGLAWWPRRIEASCTVRVVPDIVTRLEQAPGDGGAGAQPIATAGAGTEVLQLRDYRRGDPLRSIEWKATARRGHLVSRDFSLDPHLTVIVAIDAGRASGLGAGEVDRLGLYVNVAARFAQRAVALGDAVGVVLFAARPLAVLPPARGEAAVSRIRELLTLARVQPSESSPVLAAARIRSLAQQRSLVLFLTDLEETSAGEQLVRAARLLSPKHLPFIAGFQSERIDALVRSTAAEPIGAYRALAALEYAATVQANVRALRALGAAALTARPADLDAAVLAAYRQLRAQRRV